jgi:hypothetical protein
MTRHSFRTVYGVFPFALDTLACFYLTCAYPHEFVTYHKHSVNKQTCESIIIFMSLRGISCPLASVAKLTHLNCKTPSSPRSPESYGRGFQYCRSANSVRVFPRCGTCIGRTNSAHFLWVLSSVSDLIMNRSMPQGTSVLPCSWQRRNSAYDTEDVLNHCRESILLKQSDLKISW